MKIDFEGAEIIVLQGLKETINNKMPLFSITYSDFKSNVREYAAFLNEVFAGWN